MIALAKAANEALTKAASECKLTIDNRRKLALAENTIRQLPQMIEDVDFKIIHHFAEGVYAREGRIPKDTVFVGRVHLHSQINILSKGDVTVLTETGVQRYTAPCTWEAPAGTQRAAYTHEDTIWTTILGTTETNPAVIFDTYTAPTFEQSLACDELLQIVKG